MARPLAGNLQSANTCSVCLELVNDTSERSIAKLMCGHQFHLDCIGSAFNAKGSMQCPNCRQIENGEWLYGNGPLHLENSMPEDMMFEEDYDVEYDMFEEDYDVEYGMFAGVPELLFPENLMIGHSQWCPYQGSYTQLSSSFRNPHQPIAHAGVVVDVLDGENLESSESPFVPAQAPAFSRGTRSAHLHHGPPYRQHFTPSSQWGPQSPAVGPIGAGEDSGLQEGSPSPQLENQSAGHIPRSQSSRRRRSSTTTPAVTNIPANQFSPRPASLGTSTVQNAARGAQPRNNANVRRRR